MSQHGLVEGDLVDARGDLARAHGQTVAIERVELDDQRVRHRALTAEREEVGVGGEAAVPVGVAGNGDRMVQGGQAGGGQHRFHRDLGAAEQARAAGGDIGGGDQQLETYMWTAAWRNRHAPEQLAEGVEAQRVEIMGREQRGHLRQRIGAGCWRARLRRTRSGTPALATASHTATQLGTRAVRPSRRGPRPAPALTAPALVA
jgi:hypothetical protein